MKPMTIKDYNERVQVIDEFTQDTEAYKKSILDFSKDIAEKCRAIISKIDQRNESLAKYTKAMSEFDNSDKLTSPSDLFPGIRTAAEAADPEELKQKAEEMRDLSNKALGLSEDLERSLTGTYQDLQKLFKAFQEYSIRENEIYDMWMKLARDMNSIYDIGLLAKNS